MLFWRCAQVGQLSGGQRDTTPPKLINATPKNVSVNFTGKQIEFVFDEYVQVKEVTSKVIITPQVKELPEILARGKKVIVKFKDDLKSNTTYHVFFGNAICDMHESNAINNFEYVFSTGPTIDSLYICGKTYNAFTSTPEKLVTVALYEENDPDSVLFKQKPLYITKTNSEGSYRISYLPKQSFRAYAFTDKNRNGMFDGGEEIAGFNSGLVTTGSDSTVNFKLFGEESPKRFIKRAVSMYYGLAYVVFNKEVYSKAEALQSHQASRIRSLTGTNDTCIVYYKDVYDTLRLKITHGGSNDADTVKIPLIGKELFEKQKEKMHLDVSLSHVENGKVPYFTHPVLEFNTPPDSSLNDLSKIKLISKNDSMIDPRPILINCGLTSWKLNNKLTGNTEYRLLIEKGAFTDQNGIKNDSMSISFKTSSPEDLGTLNLKLFLPKKEKYIVQLINSSGRMVSEQHLQLSLTSSSEQSFMFKHLWPGQYFVKVIEDVNGDKTWNTGSIMLKKQPETIYFNAQSIKIMADWDAEAEWKVSAKE